ncbi:Clavaminate synthase-like protein, partial [Obba rivulosa]
MAAPIRDFPKLSALPIINLAPWLNPTGDGKGRISTSAALHAACLQYGFFYLDISSYVDPEEPAELVRIAREFFALPQEEKEKLALKNSDGARGYARLGENVTNGKPDNHESLEFLRPVDEPDRTKPLWGENQWPAIPGFRERYERWIEKMKKLGMIVMEAMASGLGMTPEEWNELREQVDDSFWVMRVIGYPPLPLGYDGHSCGAHKDYGCLTFLYADPTPGALQVFVRQPGLIVRKQTPLGPPDDFVEDGVWVNADPIPGCVVCNIGEMWEIWTNGLYKSTLHRVVHTGTDFRVSIPFFFEPNFHALVKPLPAAIRIQEETPKPKVKAFNSLGPQKIYKPV